MPCVATVRCCPCLSTLSRERDARYSGVKEVRAVKQEFECAVRALADWGCG